MKGDSSVGEGIVASLGRPQREEILCTRRKSNWFVVFSISTKMQLLELAKGTLYFGIGL